jgi:signal transduction histidine kinase
MDDFSKMQDSGLTLCRLLADLLELGVVHIDAAGVCRFASERACELLDARDEASAGARWSALRERGDDGTPHAAPARYACVLPTANGMRRLRVETHSLPDGRGYAVLLRDRAAIGPTDRLPMLATRAQADRAVLSGLVHAASGPLNNFNLTLAVLDAGIAAFDAYPDAAAACARLRRHLGVLRMEATSLVSTLDALRALSEGRPSEPARIDLAESIHDVARSLRHEAVVREATIATDASSPAWIVADREAITLALVALASRLLEECDAGGVVRLEAASIPGESTCSVRIVTEPAAALESVAAELFAIQPNPLDPAPATARTIIESHGGTLCFRRDARQSAIVIALPAA